MVRAADETGVGIGQISASNNKPAPNITSANHHPAVIHSYGALSLNPWTCQTAHQSTKPQELYHQYAHRRHAGHQKVYCSDSHFMRRPSATGSDTSAKSDGCQGSRRKTM
jgi:hypothetical protein